MEETNHDMIISINTLVSFFIFDALTYFLICGPCDKIMMQTALHHFIGIFAIGGSLFRGQVFLVLSSSTIITEISTPFLSGRSLLSMHKVKSGFWFYFNSILFSLTYFIFRFLYLTWLIIIVTRYLFTNPKVSSYFSFFFQSSFDYSSPFDYYFYANFIVGYALNMYWFTLII